MPLSIRNSVHSKIQRRRAGAQLVRARRLLYENLEQRTLLASIDFLSGEITGSGSLNFHLDAIEGIRPAVNYSASGTIQPDAELPGDYNLNINYPPIDDAYRNNLPLHNTYSYRSTYSDANTSVARSHRSLRSEVYNMRTGYDGTKQASVSVSTPGMLRYRINPTHPNEAAGERVRLSFSMDSILGASDFGGNGSGVLLDYDISYRIGDGSAPQGEENFAGTATVLTGGGLFDRYTRNIEIDAAIGDEIQIGINFSGNVSAPRNADNQSFYVNVEYDFALLPTINLRPAYDSRFENGEFNFGYAVEHEDLTTNSELAFYWVDDEGRWVNDFTPSDALGPAFYHHPITGEDQKTIGDHYASLPLSAFPEAPSNATWLAIVIDPLDTVEEYEEGDFWMVPLTPRGLVDFDHRNESNLDQVAVGYWPGTFPYPGGFEFDFYGIPDLDYENLGYNLSSEDGFLAIFSQYAQPLDYSVQVSQQAIDNDPLLELEDESSNQALNAEEYHRLLINAEGTPLGDALLNPAWEAIVVQADFGPTSTGEAQQLSLHNTRNFAGFYQDGPGKRGVVRTQLGEADVVTVSAGGAASVSGGDSATFASPADILLITADGNDQITVDPVATVSTYIKGGLGNDHIVGGGGDDKLFGGFGDDTISDLAGDNLIIGGLGIDNLQGGSDRDVILGDTFQLGISGTEQLWNGLQSGVITVNATFLPIGDGADTLKGGDGADVLIGGGGDDQLEGEAGIGLLLGDAFVISAGVTIDLVGLLADITLPTPLEFFGTSIGLLRDAFDFSAELSLASAGKDTLIGGPDIDILLGGDGDDSIDGGEGVVSIAFGNKGVDSIDLTHSTISVGFGGNGGDTVRGGTDFSVLIGGENDDKLYGGAKDDILIGDDYTLEGTKWQEFLNNLFSQKFEVSVLATPSGSGKDDLFGGDGFDILIGGAGDDHLDSGHMGFALGGILIGDELTIKVGPSLSFSDLLTENDSDSAKQTKSKGLLALAFKMIGWPQLSMSGSGLDTMVGSDGSDLIFGNGGNDVIQTGGGYADVVFGNEGDDNINGAQSFLSMLVGGEGNDTLRGPEVAGSFGSLLIGDDFENAGVPTPASLFPSISIDFENGEYSKVTWSAGLLSKGNGNDILTSNAFYNVMIGGDGDDTLTAGDSTINLLLGDSINVGFDFTFDFVDVARGKTPEERLARLDDKFRLPGFVGSGKDTITGGDILNVVFGGDGIDDGLFDDRLIGGEGIDLLFGGEGRDQLQGLGGFNVLVGGNGDDSITGGDFANFLIGDSFDLALPGVFNYSALFAGRLVSGIGIASSGTGKDTLTGGEGFDLIIGGADTDRINGGDGLNFVLGDSFNFGATSYNISDIFVNAYAAFLFDDPNLFLRDLQSRFAFTGTGNDTYQGGNGIDIVYGGDGDDILSGGDGAYDVLIGGGGNDTVDGQGDNDVIFGGPGDDTLKGGPGNDHLESESGNDYFYGEGGNDRIFGGNGTDFLYGGTENDELYGEGDDDSLFGEDGDDSLYGGQGTNILNGGTGTNGLYVANVAPTASGNTGYTFNEGGQPVRVGQTISISDPDSADLNVGTLEVQFVSGRESTDVLSLQHEGDGPGQIGISGNQIRYAGFLIGNYSVDGAGTLRLVFDENSSPQSVSRVVKRLTFSNSQNNISSQSRLLSVTVTDGDGGTSNSLQINISVVTINDAPAITLSGTTVTLPSINEDITNSSGILVSSLASIATDPDQNSLKGIAVTAMSGNGTWQYALNNTTWTNFGAVSLATARLLKADATTRVRFVPSANTSGNATFGFRAWDQTQGTAGNTFNISASGGTTAFSSNFGQGIVTVTPVNDAPVLTTIVPVLAAITEDTTNPAGTLVSSLVGGVSDVDTGAVKGIAAFLLNNSTGTWQYTVNGTSWLPFGTPSATTARLLAADATTRVRFVPNANFSGEVGIYFAAWDRTTGTNGGTANINTRGGITPFSSVSVRASQTITPVNDAPVLDTTIPLLASVTEDTTNPAGTLVSALVSGVSDVDTGAVKGIAAFLLNNSTGTWQYALNGTTWVNFGSPTVSTARLLAADATTRVRFVPNANYNGEVGIYFAAWDRTTGTNGGTANINTRGGITPFSSVTVRASQTITAVNDAPVLATTVPILTPIAEDTANPAGTLVSALVGGVSDVDTGAVKGIAAFLLNNSTGTWQYTLNGTSWLNFGSPTVSAARLLAADATTRVRFVPNANYNGEVGIYFSAWDRSTGTNGGTANINTRGGITPFSSVSVRASQTITAVNDAPVIAGVTTANITSNTPFTFTGASAITLSDIDAGGNAVQLTVQVSQGTLTLSSTSGVTFTSGANGQASFVIRGTLANLNAALNGSMFTPLLDFAGAASVQLTLSDLGNAGSGGTLTASRTISITVAHPTFIIDNGQTGYTEVSGTWADSGLKGVNNSGTRFSTWASAVVSWTPSLPAGFYSISIFKLASQSSSANAQLSIVHNGVTEVQSIDLRATTAGFVEIPGVFYFSGNGSELVQLAQGNPAGHLRADAVRFIKIPAPTLTIDNGQPGYAESPGLWLDSGLKGVNNSSTRFSAAANATVTWSPSIADGLSAGTYRVEFYKVVNAVNSTNAQLTIKASNATTTQSINLTTGTSGFVDLGVFTFNGSLDEWIRLSQGSPTGTLRADAVRLTRVS